MFSLIVSIVWVISSLLSLTLKAVLMRLTVADVKQHQAKAALHLASARKGNQFFVVATLVGLAISLFCFYVGLIKIWVVYVDIVLSILAAIMNVVFIGYLKKSSK